MPSKYRSKSLTNHTKQLTGTSQLLQMFVCLLKRKQFTKKGVFGYYCGFSTSKKTFYRPIKHWQETKERIQFQIMYYMPLFKLKTSLKQRCNNISVLCHNPPSRHYCFFNCLCTISVSHHCIVYTFACFWLDSFDSP